MLVLGVAAGRGVFEAAGGEETQQLIMQGPRDVTALTDHLVAEALRVIWSGTHDNLKVASLAKQLDTTSRSLERRFKQALGLRNWPASSPHAAGPQLHRQHADRHDHGTDRP
jgi:transcriptional regulator GlxA family with amidase domain